MTEQTKKRIHLIYGIVLSAVTVLAGICFIAACSHIYFNGIASDAPQIYTRQIVAESFAKIAIPVYACLIVVIGGILLDLALPREKTKLRPEKNLPLILRRLQEKTDLSACDESLRRNIIKQQKIRKDLVVLCAGLLTFGSVLFLLYACNGSHWGTNSTPSMVSAMYMMAGCLAIPLTFTVYAVFFCRKSTLAEIELMKQASVQAPQKASPTPKKNRNTKTIAIVHIALVALGIGLVVLGACNEGTKDILTKAVNICTECVGLG